MATAVSRPKRKARYTEQELLGLPDDGRKYELVHGRLREVPTGARHGWIGFRLAGRLYAVLPEHLIAFDSSPGFRMRGGNIRSPDIAVMHRHRLPEGLPPEAFVEGAPELAIEIVSPSERQSELLEKIAEYFDSGAQEVWLLLPERKQVYRYRAPLEVEILDEEDVLTGGELLPAFSLRVGELFE
jgi:Uma2 family endonuclease